MTRFLLNVLVVNTIEWGTVVGTLFIIGFILGGLEQATNTVLWKFFGKKAILITAWIGTPLHELSHALMCFVFHHKVEKVKLFQFRSTDGTLGYVLHRYNPSSLYQKMGNFFIGVAPILGGVVALFLFMYLLIPKEFHQLIGFIHQHVALSNHDHLNIFLIIQVLGYLFKLMFTWGNATNPYFWVFLALSICTAAHISLSKEDIKGATNGLFSLFILFFIANSLTDVLHIKNVSMEGLVLESVFYLLAASSILFFFSMLRFVLSYVCVWFIQLFKNRSIDRPRSF